MSKPRHKLFDRLADGIAYMPCTLKGWAILFAAIVAILAVIGLGTKASELSGSVFPQIVGWVCGGGIFIKLMRFASRHS